MVRYLNPVVNNKSLIVLEQPSSLYLYVEILKMHFNNKSAHKKVKKTSIGM